MHVRWHVGSPASARFLRQCAEKGQGRALGVKCCWYNTTYADMAIGDRDVGGCIQALGTSEKGPDDQLMVSQVV